MTVYIVYVGEYYEKAVDGVFSTRASALARIEELRKTSRYFFDQPCDEVEEREVQE